MAVRVLHVIQNLNYGGMERLLSEMAHVLDRSRFEMHVLVAQYFGRFAQGLEGLATLHQAPPQGRLSILRPAALAGAIRSVTPQVVHLHSGIWYKGARAARMAGVPRVLYTEHGRGARETWQSRFWDGRAALLTDIIVPVSDATADRLRAVLSADALARMTVVRNGVSTEHFAPRPREPRLLEALGLPAQAPVVGSIGRLETIKGYDVLLASWSMLARNWTGPVAPVLLLAGDGAERPRLEAYVRDQGLSESVRFLGWRDDVEDLYAVFDVFCLASRSEGTSVSLLEAMSCSVCPVVTAVGGTPAVLGDGLRHRLVAPESPDALAAALGDALADASARRRDGVAAREWVQQAWSVTTMVQGYERLYAHGLS